MPATQLLGRKYANGEKEKLELESTVLHERNLARLIGLLEDPRQSLDLVLNASRNKPEYFRKLVEKTWEDLRDENFDEIDHPDVAIAAQVRAAFEATKRHQGSQKDSESTQDNCMNSSFPPTSNPATIEPEESLDDPVEQELEAQTQTLDFWASLNEALHLEVAATTTKTWGRKKKYEVYQLAGPAVPITKQPLAVAAALEEAFFKAFQAHFDYSEELFAVRHTRCRAYITQREGAIWIQLNIGDYDDPADALKVNKQGRKVRKRDQQYIAVIRPESSLIALTASRRPSIGRFTEVVLAALENTLTCTTSTEFVKSKVHRIGDLNGTEPLELIKEALDHKNRALGRFAAFDRAGKSCNPVQELHAAASASLLIHQDEERLAASSKYGRNASHAAHAAKKNNAALFATSKSADCLTHGRKRPSDEAFSDMPAAQTHIEWDWKGIFDEEDTECRVAVRGNDVFAGIEAMVDAGLMDPKAAPHWVRDAPILGPHIVVRDGHVLAKDDV